MTAALGTASVDVEADASKFEARLKARIEAAVKAVSAKVNIDVNVRLSNAASQLAVVRAELDKLDGRKIKVEVDVTSNLASLSRLKVINEQLDKIDGRKITASVTVAGNPEALRGLGGVGKALDRIDGRNIVVTIDVRGNVQALAGLSALNVAANRVSGQSVRINVDLRGLPAAILQLTTFKVLLKSIGGLGLAAFGTLGTTAAAGGLLALTAAAGQALGVVALLPAALVAVGAAAATVALGAQGIGDAFTTSFAALSSAGADSVASSQAQSAAARGVTNAAGSLDTAVRNAAKAATTGNRQIEDAARSLGDAQVTAAQANAAAEKALISAQRDEQRAQESLTAARRDAREALEDLNLSLRSSELNQEGASLAVEEAQQRLREATQRGSTASDLERRQAQLAVEQAVQALAVQTEATDDLRQQTAEANAAGVEGNAQVVTAREAAAAATLDTAAALAAIQTTQQRGARDVADAERDLADARSNAAEANADAARQVQIATEALAAANEAAATAASKLSTAQQAQADALAKLAPNARDFVLTVLALKPAYDALQQGVQNQLFEGMGTAVRDLADRQLPVLNTGLGAIATTLNGSLLGVLRTFATESAALDFSTTLGNSNTALASVTASFAPLSQAFIDLSTVGSTFLPELGASLGGALTGFADKIAAMRADGSLQVFIQNALDVARQFGDVLGNVGSIISSVFGAGQAVGGGFLATLQTITQRVADFLNSVEGQAALQEFFSSIAAAVSALAPILEQLFTIFTTLYGSLADFATAAAPALLAALDLIVVAVQVLAPAISGLAPIFSALVGALAPVILAFVNNLVPVLSAVVPILQELFPLIASALIDALDALLPATMPIVNAFADLVRAVAPSLPVLGNLVAVLATGLAGAVSALAPAIPPVVQALAGILVAITPLLPVIGQLASILLQGLAAAVIAVLPVLVELVNIVVDALVAYLPYLAELFGQLIPPLGELILALLPLIPSLAQIALDLLPVFIDVALALLPVIVQVISILTDLVNYLVPILIPAIQLVGSITQFVFEGVAAVITFVINSLILPVFDIFGAALRGIGTVFYEVKEFVVGVWNGLGDVIESVIGFLTDTVFPAFLGAINAIPGVFDTVVSAIGTAWDKVKEIAAVPVRFVVDTIYNQGIRRAVNYVAEKLGLDSLTLPEITLGFATGGPVWGAGTSTSDSIPARLSNNEHVWTAREVAGAGGHGNVLAMRKLAAAGRVPAYAQGGPVTYPGIEAAVRALDGSAITTSTFRSGDPGYHGRGEAADFSFPGNPPARLNDLSRKIAAAYGNITELINLGGANIKNGRNVGDGFGLYGRATMLDHNDHVHVASDRPIGENASSGGLGGALDAVGNFLSSGAQAIGDLFTDPRGLITRLFPSITSGLGQFGDSPYVQALAKFPGLALDGLIAKVTGSGGTPTATPQGDAVQRWAPLVSQVLAELNLSPNLVDRVLRQIATESGGNPSAIQGNIGDVNNRSGDLAKGLMQVIGATFNRYAGPYKALGQLDPHASIYAGLNYARTRYGDDLSFLGQGHGYANGGPVLEGFLKRLPTFAQGGIFDEPTAGIFGEAGREALVPLDNPTARDAVLTRAGLPTPSSSTTSRTTTVHAPITVVSPDPARAGDATRGSLLALVG